MEYRFDVTTVAGIKVKSALFIDVGNIWGVEYKDQEAKEKIPEAFFNLSRLYKDLAVAGGTSLRLDFDFFLIRFDWAYKLKNPSYANIRDGWLYNLSLNNGQFQLGINYPF
jgi:outer membrane protein assembly factor BamA